jgi:hypothetical protein
MNYPVKSVTVLMLSSFAGGLYLAMSDTVTTPQVTGGKSNASTGCAELQRTCRQGKLPGCVRGVPMPNAK